MAMFLLTYSDESRTADVEARLTEKDVFHRQASPCCFALASKSIVTPKEMYDFLSIEGREFGQILITRFDSYWGFHDADFWSWVQGHGDNL